MLTVSFPFSSDIVICPFAISPFIFTSRSSYVLLTFWTFSSWAFRRAARSCFNLAFSLSSALLSVTTLFRSPVVFTRSVVRPTTRALTAEFSAERVSYFCCSAASSLALLSASFTFFVYVLPITVHPPIARAMAATTTSSDMFFPMENLLCPGRRTDEPIQELCRNQGKIPSPRSRSATRRRSRSESSQRGTKGPRFSPGLDRAVPSLPLRRVRVGGRLLSTGTIPASGSAPRQCRPFSRGVGGPDPRLPVESNRHDHRVVRRLLRADAQRGQGPAGIHPAVDQ